MLGCVCEITPMHGMAQQKSANLVCIKLLFGSVLLIDGIEGHARQQQSFEGSRPVFEFIEVVVYVIDSLWRSAPADFNLVEPRNSGFGVLLAPDVSVGRG